MEKQRERSFEKQRETQVKVSPIKAPFSKDSNVNQTVEDPHIATLKRNQLRLLTFHEKLGHVSFSVLKLLAKCGIIPKELENVPPPPPAPATNAPSEPKQELTKLTNALEKQLSEIEKTVSEKRKSSGLNNPGNKASSQPNNPFSGGNPSKFGNSMREMLKSVVSSQKNVLHKKVETIEEKSSQVGPKLGSMGKFFKNPFQSSSLSKSSQNLDQSQSKESLNADNLTKPMTEPQARIDPKRRSKSLSCETRTNVVNATNSTGTKARANTIEQQGSNQAKTRWLGKNPFETDKSPTTEVVEPNYNYQESTIKSHISGLSQESKKSCQPSLIQQRSRNEEKSASLGKQPETVGIAALIQECEEYVKTEEFTKDLSSQILKMFMQERSKNHLKNHDLIYTSTESMDSSSADNSRNSVYENTNGKHEESPDSAYDSVVNYVPHQLMSKSSSLNPIEDDEMSNASTIKNAKFSRDEIISNYDTVLR